MKKIKRLQYNIEKVREILNSVIQVKENLLDPEIVYMSKLLDSLLNEYDRLSESKKL